MDGKFGNETMKKIMGNLGKATAVIYGVIVDHTGIISLFQLSGVISDLRSLDFVALKQELLDSSTAERLESEAAMKAQLPGKLLEKVGGTMDLVERVIANIEQAVAFAKGEVVDAKAWLADAKALFGIA